MIKFKLFKYNKKDAELAAFHLSTHGIKCEIVGGIKRKGHSNKDIDLYFPELDAEEQNINMLAKLLGCESNRSFVKTDFGGVYYYSKLFGEIDCFFKHQTKEYFENFCKSL